MPHYFAERHDRFFKHVVAIFSSFQMRGHILLTTRSHVRYKKTPSILIFHIISEIWHFAASKHCCTNCARLRVYSQPKIMLGSVNMQLIRMIKILTTC